MAKSNKYGIAIDIGTTNVVFHLVNLKDGRVVNQLLMKNSQSKFGLDIISRIRFVSKSRSNREKIVLAIRDTINRGIVGLLEESHLESSTLSELVVVGNTVMHHLFFDLPTDSLLEPPFSPSSKAAIRTTTAVLGFASLPNTDVYSPPIIESFIGPDAIAVLLASGFLGKDTKSIVIDVGTNTEVSVISSDGIWIASAASGPAFEGMAIQNGIGGEMGAITAVSINPETFEPTLSILGDTQPRGICGTGSISLLASLLDAGLLLSRGSFNRSAKSRWTSFDSEISYYIVAPRSVSSTSSDIVITQPDIRMLQQSKAAIRSAIELVLKRSNTTLGEIHEILLTGVFGSSFSIKDANRIGILPTFPKAQIRQIRNGAVHGASLLLNKEKRAVVEKLALTINYVELMDNEEFDQLFVESLPFPSK